ncbi:MMPL family transporter [Solicola gregarius]|uniref:MMPL family transporter n=1 Tax=Solicola gregarius TaxID=2908642 RepID=A0AA46TDP5_9ACTN|nr:MMPL family transporter [Solicola gregarius]UYM03382.1 MMPL family transporter [Solicola gregarius]
MARTAVTVRAARWSAEHPWRAILMWVVFVAAAVGVSTVVPKQETSDADYRTGESGTAAQIIEDAGLEEPPSESIIVTSDAEQLDQATAQSAVKELRTGVADVDGVESVGKAIPSEDGSALLVPVTMAGDEDDAGEHVDGVLDVTTEVAAAHPDLQIGEAGDASVDDAIMERVGEDLSSAESMSLPITFGIMLIAFGALIAAGIPVLLAITSVVATLGLYAPLSYLAPDDGTVANVVLLIGMAVGVDYSLFYLKREREERAKGRSTLDAVEVAARTSGHAVVVSGFAVMVAMSGLFIASDVTFASLAAGSILVVGVAVVGSLTVLPALLVKLGRWVDRPRVPFLWRLNRRIGKGGIAGRILGPVVRHPKRSAIGSIVVLAVAATPLVGMKLEQGSLETLPKDIPAVQTLSQIQEKFPQDADTVQVAVSADPDTIDAVTGELRSIEKEALAGDDFATTGADQLDVAEDGSGAVLTLPTTHPEGSDANEQAMLDIRDQVGQQPGGDLEGTEWAVGGGVGQTYDASHHLSERLPWVVGFVLVLTLVMMLVMFRSAVLALLTTLLNLLSVGAAFGIMTLVFQNTWAESLLDFESSGSIIDWTPLFCFVVLVGLSMDYHVFVLSRVREGLRNGLSHRAAVERGVRDTASVVTSAAFVMVSVFAVFATLSMIEMKIMGVVLATAILIDATLVRLVLLPSLLLVCEPLLRGFGRREARRGSPEIETEERVPALV